MKRCFTEFEINLKVEREKLSQWLEELLDPVCKEVLPNVTEYEMRDFLTDEEKENNSLSYYDKLAIYVIRNRGMYVYFPQNFNEKGYFSLGNLFWKFRVLASQDFEKFARIFHDPNEEYAEERIEMMIDSIQTDLDD